MASKPRNLKKTDKLIVVSGGSVVDTYDGDEWNRAIEDAEAACEDNEGEETYIANILGEIILVPTSCDFIPTT